VRLSRRSWWLLIALVAVVLFAALAGRPALHLARAAWHDEDRREPIARRMPIGRWSRSRGR
jgi:hypothetical protein